MRPSHGKLLLENFRKLANSFDSLLSSHVKLASNHNTRVICNMADFFSTVALTQLSQTEEEKKQQKAEEK